MTLSSKAGREPRVMLLERGRVLLVENDEEVAGSVAEILAGEGALVWRAKSSSEARDLARQAFDVALVDVRLPDTSGFELLSCLKNAGDRMAEVILVTGHASLEDAIEALHRDAYAYLRKPIHAEDLVKSVERALRQVRSSRRTHVLARRLEQKEASLRTLVNTVQALLLVLDDRGRVVQANPAVESAIGVSEEELAGEDWVEGFVPEADREGVYEALGRLRTGERTIAHESRIVTRERDGRPGVRWIRWQVSAHRIGNGKIWAYASGLDSTEVRELERRTRLSERMAAVGTLTAGLAHEVRNPLNSAKLQLDLFERRVAARGLSDVLTRPLGLVKKEIQRLAALLDEFLDFARPPDLRPEMVDVSALVRQTVELERSDAKARQIALELDLPSTPILLMADADKIRQVLLNLLRNAFESVEHGGTVVVRVERADAGARISIGDDGPGISEGVEPRVFEPFFSTKSEGTGLGLAICHSLIAQHGGDIRLVPGADGTEFELLLPERPPGLPREVSEAESAQGLGGVVLPPRLASVFRGTRR